MNHLMHGAHKGSLLFFFLLPLRHGFLTSSAAMAFLLPLPPWLSAAQSMPVGARSPENAPPHKRQRSPLMPQLASALAAAHHRSLAWP
jgi:hypothetical protein